MNSTSGTLATLRRLYHHLHNGGTWSDLDTATLSRAISTIEELNEGACRFNCRTAKENWIAGWLHAARCDEDYAHLGSNGLLELSKREYNENRRSNE